MMPDTGAAVHEAAAFLREGGFQAPKVGIVLGSGLAGLSTLLEAPVAVPYREIPGFPMPTVVGHQGALIFGLLEDVPVVLQSGRFHLYEGHAPDVVVRPVRTLAELGIEVLIVTNAAGGIRRSFEPPTLMAIADQLNFMFRNPLVGRVVGAEDRFPDMSAPYDLELLSVMRHVATAEGVPLPAGVYAGVAGPSYETPAEIRMLERLGVDAVGMSTVPEVVAARARGIRVAGISAITNQAAGISPAPLSHEEVLEAGHQLREMLTAVVRGVVRHCR